MDDPRCCGTGSCIINNDGECWCGQRWDGTKMCFPELKPKTQFATADDSKESEFESQKQVDKIKN